MTIARVTTLLREALYAVHGALEASSVVRETLRSTRSMYQIAFTPATLTLTPHVQLSNSISIGSAQLTLTPQSVTWRQIKRIPITVGVLHLTPSVTLRLYINISTSVLTLTPHDVTYHNNSNIDLTTASLILSPHSFLVTTGRSIVTISIDMKVLVFTPNNLVLTYTLPITDLHMTQMVIEAASQNIADVNISQLIIDAATSTDASIRQTQYVADVATVSTKTDCYLQNTQFNGEVVTNLNNVPFRVSQFGIEILRGLGSTQGSTT